MDEQIHEMLDVYAVEVDASRAQTFWYCDQRFSWSVIGCFCSAKAEHICMTRYGRDGRLHLTVWHNVDEDELVAKMNARFRRNRRLLSVSPAHAMNHYMQTVRYD
jgi:hypothetical protein